MMFPIRFRIRSLLLLITLVAAWITWQHRSPDAKAIAAIEKSGGIAHLNGHHPKFNLNYVSVAVMPDYVYCGHPEITRSSQQPRRKTFSQSAWELFVGTRDNRVRMVEMSLKDMTPTMITHLQSLDDLSTIILNMPQGSFPRKSELGNRLAELQSTLQNKIMPRGGGQNYLSHLRIDS